MADVEAPHAKTKGLITNIIFIDWWEWVIIPSNVKRTDFNAAVVGVNHFDWSLDNTNAELFGAL